MNLWQNNRRGAFLPLFFLVVLDCLGESHCNGSEEFTDPLDEHYLRPCSLPAALYLYLAFIWLVEKPEM